MADIYEYKNSIENDEIVMPPGNIILLNAYHNHTYIKFKHQKKSNIIPINQICQNKRIKYTNQ